MNAVVHAAPYRYPRTIAYIRCIKNCPSGSGPSGQRDLASPSTLAAVKDSDPVSAVQQRWLSPVIRSLRLTTDEVQFGRVLAAICQDAVVAGAFATSVIAGAEGGHASTRRKVGLVPDDVRCFGERPLEARMGRRSLKQRAQDSGRVDLDFAGGEGWRLLVEIKLGAEFGKDQVKRYAAQRPVAAIVRDASVASRFRDLPGWVGAASWETLLPDLRSLPLQRPWREEWHELLRVMDTDGDFARQQPAGLPEVLAARELLERAAPIVLEDFRRSLLEVYGATAEAAAERLKTSKPYGDRGPWAGFGVRTRGEGAWMFFELRNLWSPAPRLRVWHWHWPDWRSRRTAREAYARLSERHDLRQLRDGAVIERPRPELENGAVDALVFAITRTMRELVKYGAFAPDVRYQARHYA